MKFNQRFLPVRWMLKPGTLAPENISKISRHALNDKNLEQKLLSFMQLAGHHNAIGLKPIYVTKEIAAHLEGNEEAKKTFFPLFDLVPTSTRWFIFGPGTTGTRKAWAVFLNCSSKDGDRHPQVIAYIFAGQNLVTVATLKVNENMLGVWKYDATFSGTRFTDADKGSLEKINELAFMCFLFYTFVETETTYIEPRQSTKIYGSKVINNTKLQFEILGHSYFTTSIRTEGFVVRPHFRVQPYGPGRKKRKVILIKGFEKKGYTRRATKEIQQNHE